MVVSTLPYEHDLLDTLRAIVSSETNFVQILPLGQQLSVSLMNEWLSTANRTLTASQLDIVHCALGRCSLPLYTRLVFEEVCQWSSFHPSEQTYLEFTVKGCINKLFEKVTNIVIMWIAKSLGACVQQLFISLCSSEGRIKFQILVLHKLTAQKHNSHTGYSADAKRPRFQWYYALCSGNARLDSFRVIIVGANWK